VKYSSKTQTEQHTVAFPLEEWLH